MGEWTDRLAAAEDLLADITRGRHSADGASAGAESLDSLGDVDAETSELVAIPRSYRKLISPVAELKKEDAEEVLAQISVHHIRILRLWHHRSLEAVSRAMARCGGPVALQSLERVAFKGCPFGPADISTFIMPVFSHVRCLKHLNLEKNQVTDETVCALVESGAFVAARLESLNLRFNRVGNAGAVALVSCPSFSSLKWVNFKMNMIGDEGAQAIARMLRGNTSMTLLNMRRQTPGLSDRAAEAFAEMLKVNTTLEQLRLRRNRITDTGAAALGQALRSHVDALMLRGGSTARFELDLEENRIKDHGAACLQAALRDVAPEARVELLIHGNHVNRIRLAELTAEDGTPDDTRLAFESKKEGLLW